MHFPELAISMTSDGYIAIEQNLDEYETNIIYVHPWQIDLLKAAIDKRLSEEVK